MQIAIILFFLASLAVIATASQARSADYRTGPAPAVNWSKTYGLPGYGWAESVYATSDGGFVITGNAYDMKQDVFLVKTSSNGDLQWSRLFGGPSYDDGQCVIQTPDGGYAIAGVRSPTLNDYTDIYLIKTDEYGTTQWSRSYGGSGPDQGNAVIAADGGYLLAGAIHESNIDGRSGSKGYLAKISADGTRLWTKTYFQPGAGSEMFYSISETTDGNYVIAGTMGALHDRICLVRVDGDGKELWTRSYEGEGADSGVGAVRKTADGGFVISGGGNRNALFLIRTDKDGNELWHKKYDTFGRQLCGTVEQLPDGGFILGGACLVRTDKDGNVLWSELANVSVASYRTAVVANSDGSYTVAGGVATGVNKIQPVLIRTMSEKENALGTAIPATGTSPATLPVPDMGWITMAGMALGIFVLIAGAIIVLLIIVLIVDERRNRPGKR